MEHNMQKILAALQRGVNNLGLEAVIAPQTASANRPQFELFFSGVEPAGVDKQNPREGKMGWERVTFLAVFKNGGSHIQWVTDTILALRKLMPLTEAPMTITVSADHTYPLEACWKRLTPGRFEYPDKEESSMPVRYTESWEVSVSYPAHIIGPGTGPQEEK
jgi:hypothetical protein